MSAELGMCNCTRAPRRCYTDALALALALGAAMMGITIFAACGGDDIEDCAPEDRYIGSTAAGGDPGGGTGAAGQTRPPCGQPDAVGNELGIGEYCTDPLSECPTEDFCSAGEGPGYCTRVCAVDTDCGSDAKCLKALCVPTNCDLGSSESSSSTGASSSTGDPPPPPCATPADCYDECGPNASCCAGRCWCAEGPC